MSKVLIIDDDGIVRDALAAFLARAGHEVVTAADGANGYLAFKNNLPDLVILDREMPAMTGSEVLGKIREISKITPVIILTGYDDPGDAERYFKDGATSFLSKADGLSQVLNEAERYLGPAPAKSKKIILVADDDSAVRGVLRRFLAEEGYGVVEAADGLEALAAAAKTRPDLILLDIRMPKRDGVSVIADFKALYPEISIVMITGNEDEEVARDCLKKGASDYVSKPINLKTLGIAVKARLL